MIYIGLYKTPNKTLSCFNSLFTDPLIVYFFSYENKDCGHLLIAETLRLSGTFFAWYLIYLYIENNWVKPSGGGGGGHLRNFGLECAAGTLEPLAYTTASSAEFCYPIFLYRVNCLKTIPFTAARTYIAHIWKYPIPPPLLQGQTPLFLTFFLRNFEVH